MSSTSSQPAKLTKKQKKGIAFRERGKGNKNGKQNSLHGVAPDEVPVMEIQDAHGDAHDTVESIPSKEKGKKKEKADEDVEKVKVGKKRKREEAADVVAKEDEPIKADTPKKKKKKAEEGKESTKQRFILFVGNLKYSTSMESIKTHFAACDPPPTVRLLTPKATAGKPIAKSKGCAFLEFTHRNALQQALKLHQSQLDGRMINVELTAGGGGKSDNRIQKLRERNKGLDTQRKDKQEKEAKDGESTTIARPQRYSATSGVEQAPNNRRTWAVEDNMDGDKTHRGGQRHTKVRGRKGGSNSSKSWSTGVNAIPVG